MIVILIQFSTTLIQCKSRGRGEIIASEKELRDHGKDEHPERWACPFCQQVLD
jgi:hypothetical protein